MLVSSGKSRKRHRSEMGRAEMRRASGGDDPCRPRSMERYNPVNCGAAAAMRATAIGVVKSEQERHALDVFHRNFSFLNVSIQQSILEYVSFAMKWEETQIGRRRVPKGEEEDGKASEVEGFCTSNEEIEKGRSKGAIRADSRRVLEAIARNEGCVIAATMALVVAGDTRSLPRTGIGYGWCEGATVYTSLRAAAALFYASSRFRR